MTCLPRAYRRVLAATLLALASARGSVALAAPETAPAGDDAVARAAKQFAEGQRAFLAGDFRRAADLFEGAYRDKPHHAALWNAARSWQKAGEEVRAANLYARYLAEAPANAPDRDQANVAVRELATRLGRVELHAAAGVSNLRLDGRPSDAAVVYVAAGEHLAEADAAKGVVRKNVRVDAGAIVSVTLEPEPDRAPEAPPAKPVAPPPDPGARVLTPAFFFAGAALSLVSGGLAVASGLDTVSKRDAFLEDATDENLQRGFSAQSRTNVAIGVTAGVAVITTVIGLFFTDWGGRSSPASTARRAAPGVSF